MLLASLAVLNETFSVIFKHCAQLFARQCFASTYAKSARNVCVRDRLRSSKSNIWRETRARERERRHVSRQFAYQPCMYYIIQRCCILLIKISFQFFLQLASSLGPFRQLFISATFVFYIFSHSRHTEYSDIFIFFIVITLKVVYLLRETTDE